MLFRSLQLAQEEISRWTPSAPTDPTKPIISPANWREEFAGNLDNLYRPKLDSIPTLTPQSAEIPDKESTALNEPNANWPAPTLNSGEIAVESWCWPIWGWFVDGGTFLIGYFD